MARVGIGSYAFPWAIGVPGYPPPRPMAAREFLERAAKLGAEVAQIADNLPLARLSGEELAELRVLARKLGVALQVGMRGIAEDNLRRHIAITAGLGSHLLRVVVDGPGHEPEPREVVACFRDMLPELSSTGVTIAIENHDRFGAGTLSSIIEEIGSDRVGVCLDTANSLGSLEDLPRVVSHLGRHTVNLHVKDVRIDRFEHNLGFRVTGTRAGEGMIDIPWLIAEVNRAGQNPDLILELWPPPQDDLEATISMEADWARTGVSFLHSVKAGSQA